MIQVSTDAAAATAEAGASGTALANWANTVGGLLVASYVPPAPAQPPPASPPQPPTLSQQIAAAQVQITKLTEEKAALDQRLQALEADVAKSQEKVKSYSDRSRVEFSLETRFGMDYVTGRTPARRSST